MGRARFRRVLVQHFTSSYVCKCVCVCVCVCACFNKKTKAKRVLTSINSSNQSIALNPVLNREAKKDKTQHLQPLLLPATINKRALYGGQKKMKKNENSDNSKVNYFGLQNI